MDCPSTPRRKTLNDITNTPPVAFPTPRRRKTPSTPQTPIPSQTKWPRIGRKVPMEDIISITKQIFGYEPQPWQLQMFLKCAEGYDTFGIAGTGYGKSLVFALLAIAVALAGSKGIVMVICPLKSLQIDQVARFNTSTDIETRDGRCIRITAVAINEDNKDESVFQNLEAGNYRICYGSPEFLLRNNQFKKLFRKESFRRKIVVNAVDEAHVIKAWKDEFRKDYGELDTLRVISGSEIPCMALTATCTTDAFEVIYDTLAMGRGRRFWGIDMGTNRPNVNLWVRPIEYSSTNLGDLLVFIPEAPSSPDDFEKTIFYFKSRSLARRAHRLCRQLVSTQYQPLLASFTWTNSPEYKETIQNEFRDGKIKWLFATTALGLGLDIPDIKLVVIYGLCELDEMFQEGGRAGRDRRLKATMIWLVESWTFGHPPANTLEKDAIGRVSKKAAMDEEKRLAMNPVTRAYINRSQSNQCMQEFLCDHFRPQPNRPGFPWYIGQQDDNDDETEDDQCVEWEQAEQHVVQGPDCGCNAKCCRVNPEEAVGLLTVDDRARIQRFMDVLQPSFTPSPLPSNGTSTTLRCSKAERASLKDALEDWRDQQWALIGEKYPFFTRHWLLSDEDLKRIVDKAHIILNASRVDCPVLDNISSWITTCPCLDSLCQLLDDFRTAWELRDAAETHERPRKRANQRVALDFLIDPFVQGTENLPFTVQPLTPDLEAGMEFEWQISTQLNW